MKTFFTEYDFFGELSMEESIAAAQLANEKLIKASTRIYLVSDTLESSTYISTTKGSGHPFVGFVYNVEPRKLLKKESGYASGNLNKNLINPSNSQLEGNIRNKTDLSEIKDECICGEINARHCPVHNESEIKEEAE